MLHGIIVICQKLLDCPYFTGIILHGSMFDSVQKILVGVKDDSGLPAIG
jgi:hypothetical protein